MKDTSFKDRTVTEKPTKLSWIGKSVPKLDALEKALGATLYVGDMEMPGMLHSRILRAGIPHAIIRHIDTSAARKVPGVREVLTAADG